MFRNVAGILAGLAGLAAAWAAAAGPAQAERYQAERAQQAQVLEAAGGAYDGPQGAYVSRIGERMAAAAGLGGQCAFTVVDNPAVNAFAAAPGCHIYVTRGLLAVMNSEAELAAVLGHEVGHVAARHAARQEGREALTGLAAALVGAFTKSDLAGQVAGGVARLSNLGYSRSQEYEADSLSLRYLPAAGYAPEALAALLADLEREDRFSAEAGQGGQAVPAWASTHPLTGDRIRRAADQAALTPASGPADPRARQYLAAIDGLAYGETGGRGLIEGRSFFQPWLRIAFEAPEGFRLQAQDGSVLINGPEGLRGEFASGTAKYARLEDYARRVLAGVAGATPVRLDPPRRRVVNGLDAAVLSAHAATPRGAMRVTVVAFDVGEARVYHFATIAPEDRAGAFEPMYASFRRVAPDEAAGLGARRIRVASVRAGDTAESLAAEMSGGAPLERFLMLNDLERGQPLAPGRLVKLVVDGPR
jgi:predicted Zn-dependent protease